LEHCIGYFISAHLSILSYCKKWENSKSGKIALAK
jgi:hypothetical protein